VTSVNLFGEGLHVTTEDGDSETSEIHVRSALEAKGIQVQYVTKVAPSIEDVFFQLTKADSVHE
jgi:hypothetical protein